MLYPNRAILQTMNKYLTRCRRAVQNSQLHSFTASQLHSFTASQLHSFTASQLHSFTAEESLCPNKFKYQLFKSRPKTARQSNTDVLSLGFFYITPFNKTATAAKDN